MSGITLKVEQFRHVAHKVAELNSQHWKEVGYNKSSIQLDPDWNQYLAIDDAGKLIVVIAYNSDDTIIGYSVDIVNNHLHHKDLKYAVNDVLYVHPAYRKTHVPGELLKFAKENLRINHGVSTHMLTMMKGHEYEGLAKASDYSLIETVWASDLKEGA